MAQYNDDLFVNHIFVQYSDHSYRIQNPTIKLMKNTHINVDLLFPILIACIHFSKLHHKEFLKELLGGSSYWRNKFQCVCIMCKKSHFLTFLRVYYWVEFLLGWVLTYENEKFDVFRSVLHQKWIPFVRYSWNPGPTNFVYFSSENLWDQDFWSGFRL